jgi:hypothetical protein
MRRFDHILRIASVLALGLSLSACEYLENLMDTKKPLPGERKPVFSDGVPGVPQGVPPELVRGYQPPPEAQPPAAVEAPVEKPKPVVQRKPRPRPESKTVAVPVRPPATSVTVQPGPPTGAALPPSAWPTPAASGQSQQPPQQQPAQQSTPQPPPWPAPPSAPSSAQAPSPWPTAPAPGTFSR